MLKKIMEANRDYFYKKISKDSVDIISRCLLTYQERQNFMFNEYNVKLVARKNENAIEVYCEINDDEETDYVIKGFYSNEVAEVKQYLKVIQIYLVEEGFEIIYFCENFSEEDIKENAIEVVLELKMLLNL